MEFPKNALLLTLSFIGVGSLAYLLFCRERDDDEIRQLKSLNHSEILVKVPKSCVGMVIGRQGANVKEIEATTGVKINFSDTKEDTDYRICRIRGTSEACQYAEALVHEVIVNQLLIEAFEMAIPAEACGRIIGKNGNTIRNISLSSNAKIRIGREPPVGGLIQVTIEGTPEQIASARSLINQKVVEEREMQSRMDQSVGNRSPRHQPRHLLANETGNEGPVGECLVPTSSDGLREVYVSAIESPERLWLQVKGPCTVDLDKLNDRMTEHYSKPEMREIHALSEVRIGQIVAAPFMYDQKYYRAEVSGEENGELVLYYVDYGDSGVCRMTHAFDLRTEFLKLRFQAIESFLAGVKPREDSWSEQATDLLEELTHVALWKPLTARIKSYRERPTRAKRDGSPVPCVDLYDTSGSQEIDVAHEMVTKGFAVWIEGDECQAGEGNKTPGDASNQQPASNHDSGCDDEENLPN